jgi:acetyl-CoA carboxylase biotin carboxyl carrier protein
MRVEEIRRLIKLVEESQINELEVRRWWTHVRIQKKYDNHRGAESTVIPVAAPAPVVSMPASAASRDAAPAPGPGPAASAAPLTAGAVDEAGLVAIRSPMVGTFYRSPSPTSAAYVEQNQRIETGQVVCIVEAMKLMNEIESETAGVIERILVQNGQPVEFNQPLFLVRPS